MSAFAEYEDKMWIPWIQKDVLHKPGDSFYSTTRCGIYVGNDRRTRATDHTEGFRPCPMCFPDEEA